MSKPNISFDFISKSGAYKNMQDLIAKALEHQWHDLVLSGLINKFFLNYKNFFVNRRGVKIKVRKALSDLPIEFTPLEPNSNITSISELSAEERRTRQKDRLLLSDKVLDVKKLIAWLTLTVDRNMNILSTYYSFKPEFKNYLKLVSNKAGQSIVDLIQEKNKDIFKKSIKFRLSNKVYVEKISQRITTLVNELDNTTKKRMVNALMIGIKSGETKEELVTRLIERGKEIAQNRATAIIATETNAVSEYMRLETARLNGFTTKMWLVSNNEACDFCRRLDGVVVKINSDFKLENYNLPYPPAHLSCWCYMDYDYDASACSNYLKEKTTDERIQNLFQKYGEEEFYSDGLSSISRCINPNALWAGGESLVGSDKNIGNIYEELVKLPKELQENHLKLAQNDLSETGYVQLRLSLGYKTKV